MRTALRSVAIAWVANADCWKKAPWIPVLAPLKVPEPSARCPPNWSSWPRTQ
jgi:hypothetical protein